MKTLMKIATKPFSALALSIVLLLSASATIAVEADLDRVTAKDFLALCVVEEADDTYAAAMGFCFGYLDAALDYHAALTAGPAFNAITCPPASATRQSISVALVQWMAANPATVAADSPIHVVMQAMAETWPCSAN
jgi:hypothetical protein